MDHVQLHFFGEHIKEASKLLGIGSKPSRPSRLLTAGRRTLRQPQGFTSLDLKRLGLDNLTPAQTQALQTAIKKHR